MSNDRLKPRWKPPPEAIQQLPQFAESRNAQTVRDHVAKTRAALSAPPNFADPYTARWGSMWRDTGRPRRREKVVVPRSPRDRVFLRMLGRLPRR